jgi:2-dehydropantoate 2-reductase
MKEMIAEIFKVAEIAGFGTGWKSAEEYFAFLMEKLIPVSRQHESSMFRDVLDGQETEIEMLNGAVVRMGKALGIATPFNETVYHMVKYAEELSRTRAHGGNQNSEQ